MQIKRLSILLLIIILLLQLAACAAPDTSTDPSGSAGNSSPADQIDPEPDAPEPSSEPGNDPEPSSEPESDPESNSEPVLHLQEITNARYHEALRYEGAPDELRLFVFSGEQPFYSQDLDISGLEEGCLYIYNENTGKVTDTGIFGVCHIEPTMDYLYALVDDESKILRADYAGSEPTVLYETDRKITDFDYYGVDANGILTIVLDEQQVFQYHIATGETEFIMEQHYVRAIMYELCGYGSVDLGPVLLWWGDIYPNDDAYSYAYFIELGEMQPYYEPDE